MSYQADHFTISPIPAISHPRSCGIKSFVSDLFNFLKKHCERLLAGEAGNPINNRSENSHSPKKYEDIGPTAGLVAYYRSFSDIPFANEIAVAINAEMLCKDLMTKDKQFLSRLRIAFEARFKSIDEVLKQYPNIRNYIEIPSGFSTRGLSKIKEDINAHYIECDLSMILAKKKEVVLRLLANEDVANMQNLHFEAVSIFDLQQLNRVIDKMPNGPIAIITEGLFSYLNTEEKTIAAVNVHNILKSRKGVWIVSDITRLFKSNDLKARDLRQRISNSTGFSPITGCFESIRDAKRFFEQIGFIVNDHRRSEVIEALSTKAMSGLTDADIFELLEPQSTFALEVKP